MGNIQDVAREAGVSTATVSRVLNGKMHVNGQTAMRVMAAAEKLQYHPSHAARTLRAHRSSTIGLLITDIQNPFFTALVRGVEDVAQRNGYSVILCNSDEDPAKERQYVNVLYSERVAGAIVVPTSEHSRSFARLRDAGIPVVAVDRKIDSQSIDAVLVDNIRGARDVVRHMIDSGYRRIGLITGPEATTTGRQRREGYRQALTEAGLPLDQTLERLGTFQVASGLQLAHELLDVSPALDGLFVANNLMTLGALEALHARGLRTPDDLALASFDEMPWAGLGLISLTTVNQPVYELGNTAALRLFQRMQDDAALSRQDIVLAPTICVRGSTRPRLESVPVGDVPVVTS